MREAKRSPELWEDGKRYAFPAFPQLLLLNKVESINPDTSGKHQPGRSRIAANLALPVPRRQYSPWNLHRLNCGSTNRGGTRGTDRARLRLNARKPVVRSLLCLF